MRLSVRFFAPSLAAAALALCAGPFAQAQSTAAQTAGNGTYVSTDPLSKVRYDERYDFSLTLAYDHMKAGPNLLQGSNLGGLDADGTYWLNKHWGAEGSVRGFYGTSGAAPNIYGIRGPVVSEYFFTAGPEWLGPHNKHGAVIGHILAGGVYGNFQQDLLGNSPSVVGFYNNQISPAIIAGGHFDLNRSEHWVFRITPDAVITHYSTNYGAPISQFDVNFAISVGAEYKFKKKR